MTVQVLLHKRPLLKEKGMTDQESAVVTFEETQELGRLTLLVLMPPFTN